MPQKPREQDSMGRFQCSVCEEWKESEEFFRNKNAKYGISTYCKSCHVAKQAIYRRDAKMREKRAAQELEEALKPEGTPEDAIYVAGYGWMIPIGKPELPVRRPLHARPDKVRRAATGILDDKQDQIPKYIKELSKLTDEQLLERASYSKPWDIPEDQQSPFDKTLLAELQARFGND